jgi:arylsulfatase A-like enzyme
VYLHEIDPHAPYEAPEPYRSAYDTGYRGRADSEKTAVFLQKRHYQELSWPDIEHLKAMYRAEVAFMDDYFGYLMDRLRDRGVLENTLVVFLSDHGEEFYEHGNIGHDFALYEESIRVPLMMYFAGILPAGRTADAAVGLVDVMPTILDLAGSATPGEIDGLSLVPEIFAPKDFPKRPERIIAQKLGRHHLSAIAVGDWKLIEQPRGKPSEPGREFALFQLSRDPGERSDRFPSEEILGKTLAQVMAVGRDRGLRSLLQFSGSVSGQPEVNLDGLDDELIENLKALGYVN